MKHERRDTRRRGGPANRVDDLGNFTCAEDGVDFRNLAAQFVAVALRQATGDD